MSDDELSIAEQFAHDAINGSSHVVIVDGARFEGTYNLYTRALDSETHLAVENAIKAAFKDGRVPEVQGLVVSRESEL